MLIELQGANDLTKPTGTAAPLILQHPYTSLSAVQKQLQALILLIHWGLPWWRWAGWFIVTCGRSRDSTKTWVFNKLRKSETHYCCFFLYSSKLSVNTSTCYLFSFEPAYNWRQFTVVCWLVVARVTRWRAVSLVLRVSIPRVKSATEIYRYLPPPPHWCVQGGKTAGWTHKHCQQTVGEIWPFPHPRAEHEECRGKDKAHC